MRRVLVESAWCYRFPPRYNRDIQKRLEPVSPEVRRIAMQAQHRLHHRHKTLGQRGKTPQKLVVAVARELAGFVWAIGQQPKLLA